MLDLFLEFIVVFLTVMISITLHEVAHGVVALWNGDYTAKANGRLSLNPVKHFDLIGFLMLMFAHVGFAKPVPINPYNFKKPRLGIFTVSIAGIVVNLLLAFFSAPFYILLLRLANTIHSGPGIFFASFFSDFFYYMVIINISLAIFNLLPLYPLDGYNTLEACTKITNKVTKFLRDYGKYILILLIGINIIINYANLTNYSPVFKYIDLLGLYINEFGGLINKGILNFWGLFF